MNPETPPLRTPLCRFHQLRLQLCTHVINFRLRLQLFENGVIDDELQITIIIETFSGHHYYYITQKRATLAFLRACSGGSRFER